VYPRLISEAWVAHLDKVGDKQLFMEGEGKAKTFLRRCIFFHYNCDIVFKFLIRN